MSSSSDVISIKKQSIFLPPSQTRLVTIAAHVDHGKTALADNLIDGIISERLAVRCLDSDPEEQRRGITIHSSAIGLKHTLKQHPGSNKDKDKGARNTSILVHLLDSPGHSDFSLEVTSALAACDNCLLVVDAVEGMCTRTHQVFREAHAGKLTPVLVVNKMDRLCTDLCLTPVESYLRLRFGSTSIVALLYRRNTVRSTITGVPGSTRKMSIYSKCL
jgi:small GTP-binding protein